MVVWVLEAVDQVVGLPGLGGGSGPIVHEANPGVQDNFSGTDGVQDTCVHAWRR